MIPNPTKPTFSAILSPFGAETLDRTFDDVFVSRVIYMAACCVGVVEP
jgi:hypothetical protein